LLILTKQCPDLSVGLRCVVLCGIGTELNFSVLWFPLPAGAKINMFRIYVVYVRSKFLVGVQLKTLLQLSDDPSLQLSDDPSLQLSDNPSLLMLTKLTTQRE